MFIPDPKTATKERSEKKIVHIFFCSHKFHKIDNFFIFEMLKKNIWANFQKINEVFTQKIFTMLSNIWVWDPGFGIRKKPIPDPGSGSATLMTTKGKERNPPPCSRHLGYRKRKVV